MTSHQTQERRVPSHPRAAEAGEGAPPPVSSPATLHLSTGKIILVWAFLVSLLLTSLAGWWVMLLAISGVAEWIERLAG
ncbi:hypothetical protein H7H48_02365 [Nitratireductor sp. B36]|uniref:hypothetical protein n=1 Tax=Nitratireductor sp. B36 TaxID=2762059 RepID=UPI001E326C2F|nr:hypothetical protein [Nitratireductor sp. B36]MCC5777881.1 hypothetical protein [Nitratireductor sp. B36]